MRSNSQSSTSLGIDISIPPHCDLISKAVSCFRRNLKKTDHISWRITESSLLRLHQQFKCPCVASLSEDAKGHFFSSQSNLPVRLAIWIVVSSSQLQPASVRRVSSKLRKVVSNIASVSFARMVTIFHHRPD